MHFASIVGDITKTHDVQVLRLDHKGRKRKIYVKRRDLLRSNGLQPRDLRRIDPSLSLTKTSPNVTVKETCILINLGGVRSASPPLPNYLFFCLSTAAQLAPSTTSSWLIEAGPDEPVKNDAARSHLDLLGLRAFLLAQPPMRKSSPCTLVCSRWETYRHCHCKCIMVRSG